MSHVSKNKKLSEKKPESSSKDTKNEQDWEVETILDRKYHRSSRDFRYLVKWKGWPMEESTWEPVENLIGAFDMLQAFEKNYQEVVLPLDRSHVASGLPAMPIDFYVISNAEESGKRKKSNKRKAKNESENNKADKKVESKGGKKSEKDSKKEKKMEVEEENIKIKTTRGKSTEPEKPKKKSAKSKKGAKKKTESHMDFEEDDAPEIVIQPYQLDGDHEILKKKPKSKGALDDAKTLGRENIDQIESPQIFIQDFLLEDEDGFGWDGPNQTKCESSSTKGQINKNNDKEVGVKNGSVNKTTPTKQTNILNLEGVRQARIEPDRQPFQFKFQNKNQNSQWKQSGNPKDDQCATTGKDHLVLPSQPVLQKSQSNNSSTGFSVKNPNQPSSNTKGLADFYTPVVLVNSFNNTEKPKVSEPQINLEDARWSQNIEILHKFRQEIKASTMNNLGWTDVLRWARNNPVVSDVVTEVSKLKEVFESQMKHNTNGSDVSQNKEIQKAKRNLDKEKSKERQDSEKPERKKRKYTKRVSKEALRDQEKNPEDKPKSRKKIVAYVVKNTVKTEETEPTKPNLVQEISDPDKVVEVAQNKMVEENPAPAEKKVLLIARRGSLRTKEGKKEKIEDSNQTTKVVKTIYLESVFSPENANSSKERTQKGLVFESGSHSQNYSDILADMLRFSDQYFDNTVTKYTKGTLNRKEFLDEICPGGNFKEDQIETIEKFSWNGPATMVKQDYLFKIIWKPRADGIQKEPSIVSWDDLKSGAPKEAMEYVFTNLLNVVSKYGTFNEL